MKPLYGMNARLTPGNFRGNFPRAVVNPAVCMTPEHLAERHNGNLQSETLETYITSMEEPGVGKQLTEDDLREHGFTDKEIARLREILTWLFVLPLP